MGRTAAGLFCAGGALALIGDLLPHSLHANVTAFAVIGTLILLLGFACLRWSKSLPEWAYPPMMVYATTLISVAVYFNGERFGGKPVLDELRSAIDAELVVPNPKTEEGTGHSGTTAP